MKLSEMLRHRLQRETIYSHADYWNTKARAFSGSSISMWPNPALNDLYHQEHLQTIQEQLGSLSGLRVLDLGCGTGRISRFLVAQGAQVTAIDFSEDSLQVARDLPDAAAINYRCASVYDPLEPSSYDVIICLGVLTVACTDPAQLRQALANIAQALRPDGRALFIEPLHRGPLHRVLNLSAQEFIQHATSASLQARCVKELHLWPLRLLLSYYPFPPSLTRQAHQLGQALMRHTPWSLMGDYKVILASRAETTS